LTTHHYPLNHGPHRIFSAVKSLVGGWAAIGLTLLGLAGFEFTACGQTPAEFPDIQPTRQIVAPPVEIELTEGVQITAGIQRVAVQSDELGIKVQDPNFLSSGGTFGVDFVWPSFRVGYSHMAYRQTLPDSAQYKNVALSLLGVDADQLWVFHGLRLGKTVFLGYGVGWQQRLISVYPKDTTLSATEFTESGLIGGLMAEMALYPPFFFSLRLFQDQKKGLLETRGANMFLSFLVPY